MSEQESVQVKIDLKGKKLENFKRLQEKWGLTIMNQVVYQALNIVFEKELGEV
jgi:hypothetical protein